MKDYLDKNMEWGELSKHLIEVLPYFVCITDPSGNIIYVNERVKKILNKSSCGKIKNRNDFIEEFNIMDQYGRKITVKDFPLYKCLNSRKEIKNSIIKFKIHDTEYYISVSSFPLIQNDELEGALMMGVDVTKDYFMNVKSEDERKKFLELSTELNAKCNVIEILRDKEKEHLMYLKDVINNISEGIVVFDFNQKISLCNKAVSNILNLSVLELINKKNLLEKYYICLENSGQDSQDEAIKLYKDCLKNKKIMKNTVFKLKNKHSLKDKYIELNSNPIIKSDELAYTILTIKDVTEEKIHEINSEKQAEFVKNVVNTLEVPIAVIDYPVMRYKLTNKKYEQIIRCQSGLNDPSIFDSRNPKHINYNLYEIIQEVVRSYKKYTVNPYSVKDKNGNKRYYKIKFVPYRNKDKSINVYIHASDITEEVNHNIELEKITKLKDEFFTVISHELRTPLTIIYSSIQLAYDVYKNEITSNMEKTLFRINQNCSRLLKLTNNILDISKSEAGYLTLNNSNFDVIYFSETIVDAVNKYASGKNIQLIFDTNEEECNVRIDKDKYEKILLNLLSNAIKFTPEGKKVLVSLKVDENFFCLSVKDYGIGIQDDKIKYIFDRFAQINSSLSRRAEGTGIGLALVKKLAELMGAKIKVKSKYGKGTEFIVKFKKVDLQTGKNNNCVIVAEDISDRINIEFSDVN
ncbi:PAS domain-containing sensor histidine kinase [Clostridium fermenticellae]|nr:PAS domain-containing sensor histidine kinase [Clostridium fermenticellae]